MIIFIYSKEIWVGQREGEGEKEREILLIEQISNQFEEEQQLYYLVTTSK